jgi:hypothetical protein
MTRASLVPVVLGGLVLGAAFACLLFILFQL